MYNTTVANARRDLNTLIAIALTGDDVVNVVTDAGNVVMLDEATYRGLLLTQEVNHNPEFAQSLLDAHNAPEAEFINESEVVW